jgi:beta-phosphoglucomutase
VSYRRPFVLYLTTDVFDSILFDFDGVLADTEPIHFACWREVLAEFGIDLAMSRLPEFVGVSDRAMLERLGAEREPPVSADELWPSYGRKQTLFRSRVQSRSGAEQLIRAETVELLNSLRLYYKLAVVSSSHRSEVEPVLERAGIRLWFHALVCGMEIPNLKPAPDPYLRAAELLSASRPLVVEDSDAGVAAGFGAGFEVLRVSAPEALPKELTAFLKA